MQNATTYVNITTTNNNNNTLLTYKSCNDIVFFIYFTRRLSGVDTLVWAARNFHLGVVVSSVHCFISFSGVTRVGDTRGGI